MTVPRDRLLPWIGALRARTAASPAAHRVTMGVVAGFLTALHDRDAAAAAALTTDDTTLSIWGWRPGGTWKYRGDDVRSLVAGWLASEGADRVVTMRGDIDRFWPGDGMWGMDGDWSCLTPGGVIQGETAQGRIPAPPEPVDPASTYIVSRRFGWFGTVTGGRIAAMDLYWDVHQRVNVADR